GHLPEQASVFVWPGFLAQYSGATLRTSVPLPSGCSLTFIAQTNTIHQHPVLELVELMVKFV
ncbi:MAG: hypothetical protein P8P11_03000, partial [Burkholderiales bacterium]|nr:hypothetical protein [Burkholderiales bacterium]